MARVTRSGTETAPRRSWRRSDRRGLKCWRSDAEPPVLAPLAPPRAAVTS